MLSDLLNSFYHHLFHRIQQQNNKYQLVIISKCLTGHLVTDEELEEMMDARIQMGKEKVDILVKYHEKFKEVIPIRKLAKYYQTGTEFKKIQLERKKQHNNPGERKR